MIRNSRFWWSHSYDIIDYYAPKTVYDNIFFNIEKQIKTKPCLILILISNCNQSNWIQNEPKRYTVQVITHISIFFQKTSKHTLSLTFLFSMSCQKELFFFSEVCSTNAYSSSRKNYKKCPRYVNPINNNIPMYCNMSQRMALVELFCNDARVTSFT